MEIMPSDQSVNSKLATVETSVPHNTIAQFEELLSRELANGGFPYSNLVASHEDRLTVFNNFSDLVKDLAPEKRSVSTYISKYVVAVAAGLFDAALNYIWDAAVMDLREKAESYDLSYFVEQTPISETARNSINEAKDLSKVKDFDLIEAAQKVGFISEVGRNKLHYILQQRNQISAAHPNIGDLDSFELMSHLKVILKEVICHKFDHSTIEVNTLLRKIRESEIASENVPLFKEKISLLPIPRIDALGKGLFGIYADPKSNESTRDNIAKLFPHIWNNSSRRFKEWCGSLVGEYVVNLEDQREEYARNLLKISNGESFLPSVLREGEILKAITALDKARTEWNNFYNEGPAARNLATVVGDAQIPTTLKMTYVETLLRAYLGNGNGVAGSAQQWYEKLLSSLDSDLAMNALMFVTSEEFSHAVQEEVQQEQLKKLLTRLEVKLVYNEARELFNVFNNSHAKFHLRHKDSKVKDWRSKLKELLSWDVD